MFDKTFFDELPQRLDKYFRRFPLQQRVAVLLATRHAEYLLVEILDYDERFITFAYWSRDNADLPDRWEDVRGALPAITVSYPDIQSIEFNPAIVREREIGFGRPKSGGIPPAAG